MWTARAVGIHDGYRKNNLFYAEQPRGGDFCVAASLENPVVTPVHDPIPLIARRNGQAPPQRPGTSGLVTSQRSVSPSLSSARQRSLACPYEREPV